MPPKKNKKPGKNGYWEFVLELRSKGTHRNLNMQELQHHAHQKWTSMSKEDRQPYEMRAQIARDTYNPTRYTTDGLEIDEVERKEQEQAQKIQEMKKDITRNLKKAADLSSLDTEMFLIVHINHLIHYPAEDRYYICEVAISAFNLRDGVVDVFHQIVQPGKLPLGYFGGATTHSKETHQLIDLMDGEEDYTEDAFREIIHFMRRFSANRTLPVLYAEDKIFEMATKVFQRFCEDYGFREDIKIYNLQYMFYALKNAAAGKVVWPTETFGYTELDKDVYMYTPGISCTFHDISDVSLYCSKSIVTRHAYTICDHCCADLGIELRPGFHVPTKAKVVSESRTPSHAPSVCSLDDNRSTRSRGESLSSSTYDDNYPRLGATKSSASSLVSFSSMKSGKSGPSGKAAARLEQSFKNLAMNDAKRDHKNLNFPEHGWKRHNANNS